MTGSTRRTLGTEIWGKTMARIFLAGASGVIGQRLIPLLVQPVEGIVAQRALPVVPDSTCHDRRWMIKLTPGGIQRRFGSTSPAVTGAIVLALAVVRWLLAVKVQAMYARTLLLRRTRNGIYADSSRGAAILAAAVTHGADHAATRPLLIASRQMAAGVIATAGRASLRAIKRVVR
jgi:hypothetical protein